MLRCLHILFFSVCLLPFYLLPAQHIKIDSLLSLLKKDKEDTNKVIHSYKLCWEYMSIGSYDAALHYGNVSLNLGRKIKFKKGIDGSYNNIGNVYLRQGDFFKALGNYFSSLKIRGEIGDKQGIASSYNNIGNIYLHQGKYDMALENHFISLKAAEEIGDKQGIAVSYNNIGAIFIKQKKTAEAKKNSRSKKIFTAKFEHCQSHRNKRYNQRDI